MTEVATASIQVAIRVSVRTSESYARVKPVSVLSRAEPMPDDHEQSRGAIACLSSAGLNPYLDLLYGALAAAGVETRRKGTLRLRWLFDHRDDVGFVHVHWPEALYRFERGPTALRPPLSWVKLAVLAVRLRLARILGYRVVWTIHQVHPHDGAARVDRTAARVLARHAELLIAHDPETAALARDELGLPDSSVEIVEHGSYTGVYPPGRSRPEVRRALGIEADAFVFLCFGEVRADSDVEVLLDAFRRTRLERVALVIAGNAKHRASRDALAAAAAGDRRIVWVPGFVPPERVRELYESADAAVVPRGDGGTSGSLILGLSLQTPVIAADRPANRRRLDGGRAGWLFRPGDADDLRQALETAAGDEVERAERARNAGRIAAELDWNEAALRIASLLNIGRPDASPSGPR